VKTLADRGLHLLGSPFGVGLAGKGGVLGWRPIGPTPVSPVTPVAAAPAVNDPRGIQGTVIELHGDTFDRESVRELIRKINEAQRDGARIEVVG
jgi:hypothetical protein